MRTKYAIISKEIAEKNGIDISAKRITDDGNVIVTEAEAKGINGITLLNNQEIMNLLNNPNK